MAIKQILPDLYEIKLGPVNAFVIDDGGLTLIDTGNKGRTDQIVEDLRTIGKKPSDIRHIHVPGHCAGQLAFLWNRHGGVMFAADTAANMPTLGLSLGYDDLAEGKRSLAKLSTFDFEATCFGHGKSITKGAAQKFRKKWGALGKG